MTATPLSALQRMTIERLRRGQVGRVPVTLTAQARAEALLAARPRLAAGSARRITVTVLLARVLATTLADHPAVTAVLEQETLIVGEHVNLGVAVAAEDGALMVPVIHGADALSVEQLAAALEELGARARRRRLRAEHVRDATFTLSSTGMVRLPVLGTPVLAPGQSGVLLAAAVYDAPVVEQGAVAAGRLLPLSFTFDHATVNGIPALRFLEDLVARIEAPDRWLFPTTPEVVHAA